MELLTVLQKRLGTVSLKTALAFTLINTVFLLLFKDIFIRIAMFAFCAIFLYFLGRNQFIDADPVPLISGIHFLMYGFLSTIQFIIWTIPATDVIANRFNQWSFVNFSCLVLSISIVYITGLNGIISLIFLILLHNFFRIIVNLFIFKKPLIEMRSVITHIILYLILLNSISFIF
jgi:hypothetical protein